MTKKEAKAIIDRIKQDIARLYCIYFEELGLIREDGKNE